LQGYLGVHDLGLLIHASAVRIDDRAVMFCGPSDAGKSTMALLWASAGATIIADDRVAIRRSEAGLLCFGTPYDRIGGKIYPTGTPLAAVFSIGHGSSNRVRTLTGVAAIMALVGNTMIPYWIPGGGEWGLRYLHEMTRDINVCRLDFVPSRAVVSECMRVIPTKRL